MGFLQPSIHYFALTTIVCTGLVCLPACLLDCWLAIHQIPDRVAGWLVGWLAELTKLWMDDGPLYVYGAAKYTQHNPSKPVSLCVLLYSIQAVSPPASLPYSYISIHRTTIIIIHSYCLLAMLYYTSSTTTEVIQFAWLAPKHWTFYSAVQLKLRISRKQFYQIILLSNQYFVLKNFVYNLKFKQITKKEKLSTKVLFVKISQGKIIKKKQVSETF